MRCFVYLLGVLRRKAHGDHRLSSVVAVDHNGDAVVTRVHEIMRLRVARHDEKPAVLLQIDDLLGEIDSVAAVFARIIVNFAEVRGSFDGWLQLTGIDAWQFHLDTSIEVGFTVGMVVGAKIKSRLAANQQVSCIFIDIRRSS